MAFFGGDSIQPRALLLKVVRHMWISYWFIPSIFLIASLFLSAGMIFLDRLVASAEPNNQFLFFQITELASARALLSTIAGSVIGVGGVVFSITMVAVSFASGTFGPRLIGNFMRDRGNQVSLGVFIGTFVYTLMTLRAVGGGVDASNFETQSSEFVPHLSISGSMLLAIVCMAVLVYFIHHVPETINIERIIARLGRQLKHSVQHRFPNCDPNEFDNQRKEWKNADNAAVPVEVTSPGEGYVQTVDLGRMIELADQHSLVVELVEKPGAFVTTRTCILKVWSDTHVPEDVLNKLAGSLATGDTQSVAQNVEFISEQLVEVIARALSPGVNDPYTAIACLNWLQVGILQFAHETDSHSEVVYLGGIRVFPLTFEKFVWSIFKSAARDIVGNAQVMNHARSILTSLIDVIEAGDKKAVCCAVLDYLNRAGAKEDERPQPSTSQ